MGELTHLKDELESHDSIGKIKTNDNVTTVSFDSLNGVYGSLSSEVVSILGRYDVELYPDALDSYDYTAVLS